MMAISARNPLTGRRYLLASALVYPWQMINVVVALRLILAVLLVVAAIGDIRTRIIPNWLNAAIALLAIPYWLALGLDGHAMLIQIGLCFAILALFFLCFAIGMMGGGDVKLLAALALWMPLGKMATLLIWMALAGGVLTLAMMLIHRLRKNTVKLEVPYGVAISVAALVIVTKDILTTQGT
jgi:prepilin peptidase CpaA